MNIVVVGSTSGIGRELAIRYASCGHKVIATGRRKEKLEELAALNSDIVPVVMDVTSMLETQQALNSLWHAMERIDLVIVCAGVGELNPGLDFSKEMYAIETNVVAWTHLADYFYNRFALQQFGHLVLITSVGGLRGEMVAPAYSASKAYQINYTEALRKKAYKSGLPIYVTDVRPGLVDTAMAKGEGLFWVMPVEKVAVQLMKAIRRRRQVAVITKRWAFLAYIQKRLPWCLYKRL